jgi:AraC-like DNA-binding protein
VRRHLDDADLAQLSVEAGFAHQSHMTRAFRERVGMTPDAYRRLGR